MIKVLLIDSYDSFTYNLEHIVRRLDRVEVDVVRNDKFEMSLPEQYDRILLSPGPGIPDESGLLLQVIKEYAPKKPILGICLGHQAIAEAFGAKLKNLDAVLHGKVKSVKVIKDDPIFKGLPQEFEGGRYHSWVVDGEGFPDCLEVIANDEDSEIMGLRHKQYDVKGLQFHPESVLTEHGAQLLLNWVLSDFS